MDAWTTIEIDTDIYSHVGISFRSIDLRVIPDAGFDTCMSQ